MRVIILLVLGLAAMAAARPDVDVTVVVPTDIKERQIMILKLLNHVMEPLMYSDIVDIGKDFKIEDNVDSFTKSEVVKRFVNMVKVGMLPRGEVFTLHVDRQLKEVVTMFHLLYYAKDFNTFIKTAAWMRIHLNEGMFVYALTVAVRHREDCKSIVLPPPYEIYPYYFVRADVIQKAYMIKMKKGILDVKLCDLYGIKKSDQGVYIIDENIYDCRNCINDEDKLRYFTEDIDLNTYYYYFHVDYPFWMKDDVYDTVKVRKFEVVVYVYQQILARYYLERLSHGMGEIPSLNFDKPMVEGYVPWLVLHNGVQLRSRPNNFVVVRDDVVDVLKLVDVVEKIILEAVMKGYVEINGIRMELVKPEDIEVLGKLIYGTVDKINIDKNHVDAYRYLVIIMKSVIGVNVLDSDKYFVVPSVLEQYQTALRDPVFYKLQKRLIDIVILFKKRLPSYTREELIFPGVKIDNVVVDKLVTYFDDFVVDITNAVVLTEKEIKQGTSDQIFWVRKRRLNHQPFKVTIDVVSDKAVDCVVRVFLGPKHDHMGNIIDINKNRLNFVEIDSFMYRLVTGKNIIVRNSKDMHNLVGDRMMTRDIIKKVETITDVRDFIVRDLKNYHTGFPTRLLLPKGRVGGMKMMLYVVVSPLKVVDNVDIGESIDVVNSVNPVNVDNINRVGVVNFRSTVLLDKMPLGYPLDRHIVISKFFTPNMKFVDVVVFHRRQVCDMKSRWESWVLKNYDMVDETELDTGNYFVNTDVIRNVVPDVNLEVNA